MNFQKTMVSSLDFTYVRVADSARVNGTGDWWQVWYSRNGPVKIKDLYINIFLLPLGWNSPGPKFEEMSFWIFFLFSLLLNSIWLEFYAICAILWFFSAALAEKNHNKDGWIKINKLTNLTSKYENENRPGEGSSKGH